MRKSLIFMSALLLAGSAMASSFREVSRAVNDDQMLIAAGLEPEAAVVRRQCSAAVIETDDPPESFDCVYVQTQGAVNLFSLEDGYLMAEMQVKLDVMDGVALKRSGRWAQVQVFSGDRIAAFYIFGDDWIDTEQTEAVYNWLVKSGVPQRSPRKWIGR